jgi:hypothetical protein
MQCRRCGKELPTGQKKTCPHCGIYLETIITPRNPASKTKRTGSKALLMSLLSVGLLVAVMSFIIPFFNNMHKTDAIAKLEEAYAELSENRDAYTDDEWKMRMASFSAAVNNFANRNSREKELIDKYRRYELILNGFNPDDPDDFIGLSPQEQLDSMLLKRAKNEFIDITGLTVNSLGVSIQIKNPSDWIIAQVRIWIEGYDERGNTAGERVVRVPPILANSERGELFTLADLWGRDDIVRVSIVGLDLDHGPETENIFFRRAVCEQLWP